MRGQRGPQYRCGTVCAFTYRELLGEKRPHLKAEILQQNSPLIDTFRRISLRERERERERERTFGENCKWTVQRECVSEVQTLNKHGLTGVLELKITLRPNGIKWMRNAKKLMVITTAIKGKIKNCLPKIAKCRYIMQSNLKSPNCQDL